MHVFPYTRTTNLLICGCMYIFHYHISLVFFVYLQRNTLVTCKVPRWFKEMIYFLINMTTKLGRDIRNFIIQKVSCTICQHILVYKSLKLIWKLHMLTNPSCFGHWLYYHYRCFVDSNSGTYTLIHGECILIIIYSFWKHDVAIKGH